MENELNLLLRSTSDDSGYNNLAIAVECNETASKFVELVEIAFANQTGDYDPVTALYENIRDKFMACETDEAYDVLFFFYLELGSALIELYCQVNFCGPEFITKQREQLLSPRYESEVKHALQGLECDGLYPFFSVDMPHLLLIARVLTSFLANPLRLSWKEGIKLDSNGIISLPLLPDTDPHYNFLSFLQQNCSAKSLTVQWWNARAVVLHARLLQKQTYEECPTLWYEACGSFQWIIERFCQCPEVSLPKIDLTTLSLTPWKWNDSLSSEQARELASKVLLEWGLACHHFAYGDHGQRSFVAAKQVHLLETNLTAAMGRRTKYQRQDVAQLMLYAHSATTEQQKLPPAPSTAAVNNASENQAGNQQQETKQEDMLEIGRRAVIEGQGGEEAVMREVPLDLVDTGVENILFEGGPKLTDPNTAQPGGQLAPYDQVILLALCLDVANSNPSEDQLTNEEMMAYIERVLVQPANWMIHSTALLERSWIEFERRKTADRAMLQIQALIDQHSTKLTYTQASYQAIAEAAPAHERLRYIHQLVYPAVLEVKRDLAMKYLRSQVFVSALNYFKELEMWDEVVTCYQLMQKPTRAEIVVREQLKNGESPYMLTALADLTGKEEIYERAWTVSKHRYPRAKRTLAKICFDRGDFAKCNEHLMQALAVQPLVHTAWYLKGIACMRMENWEQGAEAFVRCIHLEDDVGEAWANLGAIHMKTKSWAKAQQALIEALKHKNDDWRILENLLGVSLALSIWKDAVRYMSALIDLRFKAQQKGHTERPVHLRELQHVVLVASVTARQEEEPSYEPTAAEFDQEHCEPMRSEERDRVQSLPELATKVEQLLDKITNTISNDPKLWDVYARFNIILGRYAAALETRIKQFRTIVNEPNWLKDPAKLKDTVEVGHLLCIALRFEEAKTADAYQVRTLVQTALRRMEVVDGMKAELIEQMREVVTKSEKMEQQL